MSDEVASIGSSQFKGTDDVSSAAFEHADVVERHHRFSNVAFRGQAWDLTHLDSFAITFDPGLGQCIDVVILFSSHCFTHSLKRDSRPADKIPADEIYDDGRSLRVLSEERYVLSRTHLRALISGLPQASIRFARENGQNFFTLKLLGDNGFDGYYTAFFEITKDRKRSRRVLLHVQSAYRQSELNRRLKNAGKIRLATLVRARYQGRPVHT